jgi:hypothetical protein
MHKPNDQTVVLWRGVSGLLRGLPLGKIKGLGGKVRACTISAPPRLDAAMAGISPVVPRLPLRLWPPKCLR